MSQAVTPVAVHRATARHTSEVVGALSGAFFDDPILRWALPDADRRRRALPPIFSLFTEYIQRHDETYVAAGGGAAALWVPPGRHVVDEDQAEEFGARLESAAGIDAPRLFEVSELLDEHHPAGSFYFLNLLAVVPDRQGEGLGSALLAHTLERCDREGVPAYLDATSEHNRRLYERHGFEAGTEYGPAGGPPLYPMWREPRD
jgi:GNAT superfamily N-acetyltransferase